MYNNKFLFAVYGTHRIEVCAKLELIISTSTSHSKTPNCDLYVNQIYDTGIPDRPHCYKNITIQMHGIIFPWDRSIDSFSSSPSQYYNSIIEEYKFNLHQIGKGFRNGSYAGVILDDNDNSFYAITSFLNTIPVYYCLHEGVLIVSTDIYLIAKVTDTRLSVLSPGLLEYYVQGTNLSDLTAFEHIKSIPKGGYLQYKHGVVTVDHYYTMPQETSGRSFSDIVDEFATLWDSTIASVHSERYNYGLGLTGGIDSRLIFSALIDRSKPLLYTGSHPDHPDYLLAKSMSDSFGLSNHVLEDYRKSDKLKGYAEYCLMGDNPLNNNSLYYSDQMLFRKNNKIVYEFYGLTEFLGGVYHYQDRSSILNAFYMSLPIVKHRLRSEDFGNNGLLRLGLRNATYESDLLFFGVSNQRTFQDGIGDIYKSVMNQLGDVEYIETFLERFRHIHKMSNLLSWTVLGGRRFNEHLSPSMNIEMTDFACKTPLEYRDSRRLLLAYLKRYHPETAKFVLSGYIFSAKSPWLIYKTLSPHIKVLNHLGIKIPALQWYIKKHNYRVIGKISEIQEFQKSVIMDSDFTKSIFLNVLNQFPNDHTRLIRVFNIAITEKMQIMRADELNDYLIDVTNNVRNGKTNEHKRSNK